MVLPRLLHPVDIVIQQINRAGTRQDDDYREPIQRTTRHANKTVPGQVKWESEREESDQPIGVVEEANGYVLFRYVDLNAKSVTLAIGDKFIKTGNVDTNVYIVRLEPCGHYADQLGPTMVKAHFLDRQPSSVKRGE